MTSDEKLIAVEPKARRFENYGDGPGLDAMIEQLQSQRETQPVQISTEADVLLNSKGLIQGHYRLTTVALQQLCSVLAPGLTDVIRNVAGQRSRGKQFATEKTSAKRAVEILNNLITFRFELLTGHAFIMDRRNKQVEGLVGQKYRFLSNLEMYTRVEEFLRSRGGKVRFCEAVLAGRRLLLRYKSTERAFALATPVRQREPFYAGLHFSNSELGDCCVKGAPILYRQWSKTAALFPFTEQTKLKHFQGEKFNERFNDVLTATIESMSDAPELSAQMKRMTDIRLGLGGPPEDHKSRMAQIVTDMTKGKVRRKVATNALHRAMAHGSYKSDGIDIGEDRPLTSAINPDILQAFRHRTVYDLFNGLCYIARQHPPAEQEVIEQKAYQLLNNKITIT